MLKLRQLSAACLITCASPALADEFFAVTPSGATEMLFPERPTAVIGKLSSRCIDFRWTVVASGSNELVCEAPLNFGQSLMGQMLMGNSYSTPPRRFFRFNVAEVNGISRVQASGWMELQMAFGQMKRTDFSGPEFHNGAMGFLMGAGGKFPTGTRFPNHAMIGVSADQVAHDGHLALRVKSFEPGSPAEQAGVQPGDLVVRIANKRFKNDAQYFDATAKAAEKPSFEIEVLRAGKPTKLTVQRAFRPDVTETVVAAAEPAPAPAATAPAALSVADELAKLAKLKADGVLTESEFQAQKSKLLSE